MQGSVVKFVQFVAKRATRTASLRRTAGSWTRWCMSCTGWRRRKSLSSRLRWEDSHELHELTRRQEQSMAKRATETARRGARLGV